MNTLIINYNDIKVTIVLKEFVASGKLLMDYVKEKSAFKLINFIKTDDKDKWYRKHCDNIVIPKKYIQLWNQYKFIESQPQPVQKSTEWYMMRDLFITASSGAQAINESKYESAYELLKSKLGLAPPFKENFHVHHGKKLESIATITYEYINNVKVGEFGLIAHISEPQVPFLGASPDGICSCTTLDGKFSKLVGRMLEIKCVTTRKLNVSGPEHVLIKKGETDLGIIPHVYWIQIQLQLECCDLDECDFWQCKIKNYWSERLLNEAVIKVGKPLHFIEQGDNIEIDPKLEVGTLIELIPINKNIPSDEKIEWYGKYIYPPKIDISLSEKIAWALDMKKRWKELYPEYATEYEFGKILYYHIELTHRYLVKRDRKWFNDNKSKFESFWSQVQEHKNNPVKMQELLDKIANENNAIQNKINKSKKEIMDISMDSDSD